MEQSLQGGENLKDAYYFSHDSNARNDTKILAMRCDYGLEGYGMYWIIVETLRDESEYKLPLNEKTYKALAMQMHSKADAVDNFINDCIHEYELFSDDGQYFWAESLMRRMSKLEDIREKRRKAAEKRWDKTPENRESDAKGMQMHNKSNASEKQTDAKESKAKESKVNKNKYGEFEKVKLTKEEHSKLINRLGEIKTRDLIDRLDNYKESTGKTYKSDYATILNWHRREAKDESGVDKVDGGTKKEGEDIAKRAGVLSL